MGSDSRWWLSTAAIRTAARKCSISFVPGIKRDVIDLVVSTHPDADHINGLQKVLEGAKVRELLLHRPVLHGCDDPDTGTEAAEELASVAKAAGVPMTEPFTGLVRFGGSLTVAGPSREYYKSLLPEEIEYGRLKIMKMAERALRSVLSETVSSIRDAAGRY